MQLILVIILVSLAVFYLGWQLYKHFFKKEAACESCAFGGYSENKLVHKNESNK